MACGRLSCWRRFYFLHVALGFEAKEKLNTNRKVTSPYTHGFLWNIHVDHPWTTMGQRIAMPFERTASQQPRPVSPTAENQSWHPWNPRLDTNRPTYPLLANT